MISTPSNSIALSFTLALPASAEARIAALGLLLVLAACLAWLGLRWMRLRQIKALLQATERIAQGDYDVQTPLVKGAGLKPLAGAFNQMAAHLRENTDALQASERRFRRVIESDLIGIFFWNGQGVIADANDLFLRMVGRTRDEIQGGKLRLADLTPSGESEFRVQTENSASQRSFHAPTEREFLRKDGSRIPILLGAAHLDGAPDQNVGFVIDITPQRQAAEALRESEEKFRSIVETTSEWIWSVDARGRYTYTNPAIESILGYAGDELLKQERLLFMREDDQPQMRKFWETFLAEKTGWNGLVIRWRHKDGSERFLQSNAVPVCDANGHLLGFRGADRDITEQKKRERLLDENEQRYKSLFEFNIDAVFSIDLAGQFFSANPACEMITGYGMEELLHMSVYDVIVMEDLERARQHFLQAGRGVPQNLEIAVTHKRGHRVELNLSQFPIRVDSQIVGVYGVAKDITERKRLQEERDRLFNLSLDMFFIAGFDGSFKQLNPAWKKHLGFSREELMSKPVQAVVHPEDRAAVRLEWEKLASGVPARNVENRYLCKDGAYKWFAWTAMPLPEQRLIYAVARDITEEKRAQESIRQSEERYRSLVESARDAIFTLSPEGVVTSLNTAFETITGWPRGEWQGKHFTPLVHPVDAPIALDFIKKIFEGEKVPSFEVRVVSKHGGYVHVEATITAQMQGGKIVGVLCIGRDVTERKRLEEQLRQMQKLDSIGQLAAGIAHDFNNILTVQQGYLSMLRLDPGEPPERLEALRQVAEASERAANLTRQLLLFSRKQVMQPQTQNLNEVITPLTKMLSRILGEDISLQFNYAPNLPAIHADTGMLEQVIVNLAVNARDAMPVGGRLIISTGIEHIEENHVRDNPEARAGEFVFFSVADTGCGIPPENLKRIFEPFFTTKDVGKGTGLGLATAYGIVAQHRGWIEVESRPNEGSTFKILLPSAGPAAVPKVERVETEARGGRESILVVEDEPALRDMVKRILERFGYRVILATSGLHALKLWDTCGPDVELLLTDMIMPDGVNGRTLAEQLLARKPGLCVIYTSGYSADIAGQDLTLREGFNFLQKPYHPHRLAQIVREALDRAKA